MNTVLVQPKILIAMLELAGKNDIRFYLNSVFLEIRPAFINYVATDGAKLGAVASATRRNFTIASAKSAANAMKASWR